MSKEVEKKYHNLYKKIKNTTLMFGLKFKGLEVYHHTGGVYYSVEFGSETKKENFFIRITNTEIIKIYEIIKRMESRNG